MAFFIEVLWNLVVFVAGKGKSLPLFSWGDKLQLTYKGKQLQPSAGEGMQDWKGGGGRSPQGEVMRVCKQGLGSGVGKGFLSLNVRGVGRFDWICSYGGLVREAVVAGSWSSQVLGVLPVGCFFFLSYSEPFG